MSNLTRVPSIGRPASPPTKTAPTIPSAPAKSASSTQQVSQTQTSPRVAVNLQKNLPRGPSAPSVPSVLPAEGLVSSLASAVGNAVRKVPAIAGSAAQSVRSGLSQAAKTVGSAAAKAPSAPAPSAAPGADFASQAARTPTSYADFQKEYARLGLANKLSAGGTYGNQDASKRLSTYEQAMKKYQGMAPEQFQKDWRAQYLYRRMQQDAYRSNVLEARKNKGDVGQASKDYNSYLRAVDMQSGAGRQARAPAATSSVAPAQVATQTPAVPAQAVPPVAPPTPRKPPSRPIPWMPEPGTGLSRTSGPTALQRLLWGYRIPQGLDRMTPRIVREAMNSVQ